MSDEAAEGREVQVPEAGEAPAEPEFPAVPPPDPTGDPRVDAAVARLGELGARPVPEHVEIFEDVHQRLQELLAAADQDDPQPPHVPHAPQAPHAPQVPEPPRVPRPAEPAQPGQQAGASRPAFPDALRPRP
ncbi:hypothetical protein [Actinomadura sp. 9N215]|uniref:hypothetical protein n=1 Tax=Actinomadura sp. 9N215 TaxID=3375150 RepID=UPI0037AB4095